MGRRRILPLSGREEERRKREREGMQLKHRWRGEKKGKSKLRNDVFLGWKGLAKGRGEGLDEEGAFEGERIKRGMKREG